MIRPLKVKDIPKLRSLGCEWEFGDDLIEVLVVTNNADEPVMFSGAWRKAEVHICLDKNWSTPGARMCALKQLHEAMEKEVAEEGVTEAITWFGEELERFKKRLAGLGWVKSQITSWHRRING